MCPDINIFKSLKLCYPITSLLKDRYPAVPRNKYPAESRGNIAPNPQSRMLYANHNSPVMKPITYRGICTDDEKVARLVW